MTTRLSLIALALLAPALALAQTPPASDDKAPAPAAAPAPAPAPEAKEPAKDAQAKDATGKDTATGITLPPPTGPLAPLAWLSGCWAGNVNQRDFREYWHPLRGGMMVGVSHNAMRDRTVSFEHLRLEAKPDGVFYVATTVGEKEVPFKLTDTRKEGPDEIFTFTNGANAFPQVLTYRHATGGWLYVEVGGKQDGKDRKVIYPFRRVDCETGEFIRK